MIITKNIEKIVTQYNLRIFKKFGYSIGDNAVVSINDWDRNSHEKVLVKCDICGIEKLNQYRQYMDSYEKYKIYSCSSKCSNFKNRKTCLKKYDDEKYKNKEKYKETCLKKYGVDNTFKSDFIINKIDNIKRKKYGLHLELIVEKYKETCFIRYGVDNVSKLEEIKEIKKQTCFKNYGENHPMHSEVSKQKSRETCFKNYGFPYPIQSKEVKDKRIQTCLERYGVKNYVQSQEYIIKINRDYIKSPLDLLNYWKNTDDYLIRKEFIYDKIRNTNITNGNWFKISSNKYKNYRNRVDYLTSKNKNELLESWNGCDYYDDEFILPYFKLNSNSKLYPTIDHKISVKNGFLNNMCVNEISSISNLCLTKRHINSKKSSKNEIEFLS